MIPQPMEDPRDSLEKATRWELYDYAKKVGCSEVREPMPHLLAAQILRARGFTKVPTEVPALGSVAVLGAMPQGAPDQTVDAVSDLKRQYEQQQANPDPAPEPAPFNVEGAKFNEIRAELKRRGVKLSRKDTLEVLKAKLNG